MTPRNVHYLRRNLILRAFCERWNGLHRVYRPRAFYRVMKMLGLLVRFGACHRKPMPFHGITGLFRRRENR